MAKKLNGTQTVVAVTGGARGIGFATATALVASGAKVAVGDIHGAQDAAARLGGGSTGHRLDVTDPASFAGFIAAVERDHGPLDVLINNAGIMPIGPFLEEEPETAARVLLINVQGCLNGMKAVLPGMLSRGRGHIINTSSVAGKSPVPGGLTYAASKAAVVSATETARVEYAGSGLHFTCLMPSFTNTDLVTGTKGTRFVKNVEPEDVANAVVGVIARPRPDVTVPAILGGVIAVQSLVGRRVRDSLNHAIKADRAFLDVDRSARASYENRIAPSATGELESAADLVEPATLAAGAPVEPQVTERD